MCLASLLLLEQDTICRHLLDISLLCQQEDTLYTTTTQIKSASRFPRQKPSLHSLSLLLIEPHTSNSIKFSIHLTHSSFCTSLLRTLHSDQITWTVVWQTSIELVGKNQTSPILRYITLLVLYQECRAPPTR